MSSLPLGIDICLTPWISQEKLLCPGFSYFGSDLDFESRQFVDDNEGSRMYGSHNGYWCENEFKVCPSVLCSLLH